MKNILWSILLIVVGAILYSWASSTIIKPPQEETNGQLYLERYAGSIYKLYVQRGEERSTGTAFIIAANGVALTAAHVVDQAEEAYIVDDAGYHIRLERVLAMDTTLDYAILQFDQAYPNYQPLPLTLRNVGMGEYCFTIGSPEGEEDIFSQGEVGQRKSGRYFIWQNSTFGASGSPVFDGDGRVFAVLYGGSTNRRLTSAVSLREMPLDNYLSPSTAPVPHPNLPAQEVLDYLDTFIASLNNRQVISLHHLLADSLQINNQYTTTSLLATRQLLQLASNREFGYDPQSVSWEQHDHYFQLGCRLEATGPAGHMEQFDLQLAINRQAQIYAYTGLPVSPTALSLSEAEQTVYRFVYLLDHDRQRAFNLQQVEQNKERFLSTAGYGGITHTDIYCISSEQVDYASATVRIDYLAIDPANDTHFKEKYQLHCDQPGIHYAILHHLRLQPDGRWMIERMQVAAPPRCAR